jgi:DNA-binding GntR family transcriptional regulator
MSVPNVDPVDEVIHHSFADAARERIMQDILQLRLLPGEMVQLRDLADAYGMSRTPIREALKQLQQSGLVLAIPYKGYRIRPLDKHDVADVVFMRDFLEAKAAELAAERITVEELAALESLQPPHTDEVDLDFDRYSERFHTLIGVASGSRRLAEMIAMVFRDSERLQSAGLSHPVTTTIVADHAAIVDAIRRRDPQAARLAMSKHVQLVQAGVLDDIEAETR